jgi:predicted RNA-binding protein YlqC (UPF0109 family)
VVGLVEYMVRSLAEDAEAIEVNATEGDASTLIELSLGDADRENFLANDAQWMRAMRQILSASGGHSKTILELTSDPGEEAAFEE